MKNRYLSLVGLAVLAGAVVLLSPGESQAQRRGGGGGWGGGGYGGGGYGGGRSGVNIGIGYSSYGGLSAGVGYGRGYGGYGGYGYPGYGYGGYGGYGRGGYGGYGLGLGYGRGYGYGGYGGYSSPSYYGNYASVTPYYGDNYGGDYSVSPSYAYAPQTAAYQSFYPSDSQQSNNSATVNVMVPADAEVWFDGNATQQRGPFREFTTPPLDPNRTFTYQIRARWMQNGQAMDQTRSVQVQANRAATVDFSAAQQQNQQPQVQQNQPQRQQPQQQPPQQFQQPQPPAVKQPAPPQ